jgi:hypothetical protein
MNSGMRPVDAWEGAPRKRASRLSALVHLCSALLLLLVFAPASALAWGDAGHIAINRTAAEKIPTEMPWFLRAAAARLAWLGPEPDRWRSPTEAALREAQAPDHYIDLEEIDWLRPLPPDRYSYIRAIYDYRAAHPGAGVPAPEKIGFQPYIAIEIYDRLKVAFRQYRRAQAEHSSTASAEADAIFYAGWLGHYVGDGSNPMHTSIHYNGWVGENPKHYTTSHELHTRMEATFVDANPEVTRFADLVGRPRLLDRPFDDYLAYLRQSQSMIERCYQLEKMGGFEGHGTAESREFIRRQLGRGAQMLLNLWYTAWVDSAADAPAQD